MPFFSIITTAITPLTIQSILMECTVYRMVYPYGFVPHTIVIIVLCRVIWCRKKDDKDKSKSHPRILPCSVVEHTYN